MQRRVRRKHGAHIQIRLVAVQIGKHAARFDHNDLLCCNIEDF